MRKGRITNAAGNIGPYTEFGVGGGDCGAYTVRGSPLYNSSGSAVVGGDSGGPIMLAYYNQWFLGGITSAEPGAGNSGYSAWIDVPSGWTACTGANPSCVG